MSKGFTWAASGLLEQIAAGALVIDSSTIAAATSRKVAEAAAKRGIAVIDAPVSGGTGGAIAGTLTFMVGGAEADLERAGRCSRRWAPTSSTPVPRAPARPPRSATTCCSAS